MKFQIFKMISDDLRRFPIKLKNLRGKTGLKSHFCLILGQNFTFEYVAIMRFSFDISPLLRPKK